MYDNKSFSQITEMLKDKIISEKEARQLLRVDDYIKSSAVPTGFFDIVLEKQPNEPQELFIELEDENGHSVGEHPLISTHVDEEGYRRIRIHVKK